MIFFIIWYFIPVGWRLWVIIVGSLFFYGYWNWNYLIIPIILTLIAHVGGKWISDAKELKSRTFRLGICALLLIIPLFNFKYLNFFAGKDIITFGLPLGISFITFTLLAYLVDVFRRTYPVEERLAWLMAHVTYFPQLIAGPILRPGELLPQLKQRCPKI